MVLRSYFDGGNQADSRLYRYLSLACISGPEYIWTPFEDEWKTNLFKHGAPFLHTTDLLTRHDVYEHWNRAAVNDFLSDCVGIAKRHIAMPKTDVSPGRFGLLPYIVTVSLKDLSVANLGEVVDRNANLICIRQSLHSCLQWGTDQAACNEYLLYFDQGEPFYGVVKNLIESKRASKDVQLLKRIIATTEINMRNSPALQLADLYAWSVSHYDDINKPEWHEALVTTAYSGEYIDRNIMETAAVDPGIWASWRIPKRGVTP